MEKYKRCGSKIAADPSRNSSEILILKSKSWVMDFWDVLYCLEFLHVRVLDQPKYSVTCVHVNAMDVSLFLTEGHHHEFQMYNCTSD